MRICAERTLFRALFVAALEVLPPAGQILLLLDGFTLLRVVERRRPGTAGGGCGSGLSGHAGVVWRGGVGVVSAVRIMQRNAQAARARDLRRAVRRKKAVAV